MDTKKLYSKKMLHTYRIFSIIGLIISVINVFFDIKEEFPLSPYFPFFLTAETFFNFIQNVICSFTFIVLIFKPQKFEYISIMSFLYTIQIIVLEDNSNNIMGLFMYLLGISSFLIRGFFKKNRKLKYILSAILYLLLCTAKLRFGYYIFIHYLIQTLGFSLVFAITLFFILEYFNQQVKKVDNQNTQQNILDLSQFPELTDRDKLWIHKVQSDAKYETIAKESNVSLGTMKNRMHQIFKIIDVPDRISFLSVYGGYTIKD